MNTSLYKLLAHLYRLYLLLTASDHQQIRILESIGIVMMLLINLSIVLMAMLLLYSIVTAL